MLPLRYPVRRQPQFVGVLRHADMPFAWYGSAGYRNAADGAIASSVNSAFGIGEHGTEVRGEPPSGYYAFGFDADYMPVATSNPSTRDGDYTIIALVSCAAGTTSTYGEFVFVQANYSTYNGLWLAANVDANGIASAGNFMIGSYNNGGWRACSASGVVDGRPHVYIGVKTGSGSSCVLTLYVDGAQVATASSLNLGAMPSSGYVTVCGRPDVSHGKFRGSCPSVAVLNRALPADEISRELRTPDAMWNYLFRPVRRDLYLAAAAASLPTLSSATYVPGSITSVGFRPRVTAS